MKNRRDQGFGPDEFDVGEDYSSGLVTTAKAVPSDQT